MFFSKRLIKRQHHQRSTARLFSGYMHIADINISFTGDWNQFATFLNSLERRKPVIFVDKFTIARADQDDSVFQVNLNVAAFVRKQQDGETDGNKTGQVYGKKI